MNTTSESPGPGLEWHPRHKHEAIVLVHTRNVCSFVFFVFFVGAVLQTFGFLVVLISVIMVVGGPGLLRGYGLPYVSDGTMNS